ncbi:MAG: hypothetical protein AAGJ93_14475, partial [Bacteroidota bacterium]
HFTGHSSISFVFAPGESQSCQTVEIPFSNASNTSSYQLELQNISGTDVAFGQNTTLEINVNPAADECWEIVLAEGFNASDQANFGNLPHIAAQGFDRSSYGGSGLSSDACARITSFSSAKHLGFYVDLEAGRSYRLKWNAKTNQNAKLINFLVGSTLNNLVLESGPYNIPVISINQASSPNQTTAFSVAESGQYYLLLQPANGSSASGHSRIDDLQLEISCGNDANVEVYFTQENITTTAGNTIEICAGINHPATDGDTQVDINIVGNSNLHFPDFTPITLNFPSGFNTPQCVNFDISENEQLTGDLSYIFTLENPSSSKPIAIVTPDTLYLTVTDNLLTDDCDNWLTSETHNLDYVYGLPDNYEGSTGAFLINDHADYANDYSFYGRYSPSFYFAIPVELNANYDYRLKWKSKMLNGQGNPVYRPLSLDIGPALDDHFTVPITTETDPSWSTHTSDAITVPADGTYYFIVRGVEYTSLTDIFLDDFSVQRICRPTNINFAEDQAFLTTETEGDNFTLCLDISRPSNDQATTASLVFINGASPHFSTSSAPLTVTFPAGSSARQCLTLSSSTVSGIDPKSEYHLQISEVTGGVHAVIGEDQQRILKVLDQNDCWVTHNSEDFTDANGSLTSIDNLLQNNSASKSNYGASGQYSDICARMRLSPGKHFGFRQNLQSDQ